MDTGLCGFYLCLLWGDVADGGVDPHTIVIAFDMICGIVMLAGGIIAMALIGPERETMRWANAMLETAVRSA